MSNVSGIVIQQSCDMVSHRGYTGHTALGTLGLNHMNGRVQDAITGRFLSADPYVPYPDDTQSYNRYTYVRNNPLSYIDPSGFADCVPIDAPPEAHADPNHEDCEEAQGKHPPKTLGTIYAKDYPQFDAMSWCARFPLMCMPSSGGGGGEDGEGEGAEPERTEKQDPRCKNVLPDGKTVNKNVREISQRLGMEHRVGGSGANAFLMWLSNVLGSQNYKAQLGGTDSQGNFNYGATGKVFFSQNILDRAAGAFQLYTDPSRSEGGHPLGLPPYGDQFRDQADINAGFNAGCM